MSSPQAFMQELFRDFAATDEILWNGHVGHMELDETRVVRFEPKTQGYAYHYVGVEVTILNKGTGHVDSNFFHFDHHLSERSDTRSDYTDGFQIVSTCGWSWYIAKPATVQPLMDAIWGYIQLFV